MKHGLEHQILLFWKLLIPNNFQKPINQSTLHIIITTTVLAEDVMLKLIAVCNYHLYSAFYIMDHQDLLLSQAEADDTCPQFIYWWGWTFYHAVFHHMIFQNESCKGEMDIVNSYWWMSCTLVGFDIEKKLIARTSTKNSQPFPWCPQILLRKWPTTLRCISWLGSTLRRGVKGSILDCTSCAPSTTILTTSGKTFKERA